MGDPSSLEELREIRRAYRLSIIQGLERIRDRLVVLSGIQYFENDQPNLGGTVGGIALNYLLDDSRPIVALTPDGDLLRVSTRGTWDLVSCGLDLARALHECAAEVGGSGGGHPIAAGATIPAEKRVRFIELLDAAVARQIGRG
jgi:RecJ-like exonuclease